MNSGSRVCLHSLLGPKFPTSGDRMSLYRLAQGVHPSHGRFIFCLQGTKRGGQSVLLALVVPQGSLFQTNAFATLAYLGVTCPEPQHDACLMAALSSRGDHGLHVTGPGPASDHTGILTSGMRGPSPSLPPPTSGLKAGLSSPARALRQLH